MYRTHILTVILTLMFFAGCDKSSTGPSENYTIDDIVGTWDMVSNNMNMNMTIDFSTAFTYMFDEQNCSLMGGAYDDQDGCILSDDMISTVAPLTCEQMEGQLSNNICTSSQSEEICCQELSQTITITSDGNLTMVTSDTDGEETSTGTISIDGTDITWIIDNSPEMMGTLSISGDNIVTFTFIIDNVLEELIADDEADESFIDAEAAGAISITATVSMVMQKSNN